MKLGNYVEIRSAAENVGAAKEFYASLGFQLLDGDHVTDGSIVIHVVESAEASDAGPALAYAGTAAEVLENFPLSLKHVGDCESFTDPDGLCVLLSPDPTEIEISKSAAAESEALSRCGKFGELAVPVKDAAASARFWSELGFDEVHSSQEPYPFSIMSDGLIVIGLHQTDNFDRPHITYFAADMEERIASFEAEGMFLESIPSDEEGTKVNAAIAAPDGNRMFLFKGEI